MNLDIKTVLGILLVIAAVSAALVRAFRQESDDSLRHNGRVVMAEVVGATNTGQRFRHGPEVEVRVRFVVDGREHNAHFKQTASVTGGAQLRPGTLIEIAYDPRDPRRAVQMSP